MPCGSRVVLRVAPLDDSSGFVPDVQGGVHVPVVQDPALRARPFPDVQVLGLRVPVAAVVAQLARREPPVHPYQPFALAGELVFQHGAEHAVGVVQRAFRQSAFRFASVGQEMSGMVGVGFRLGF